MTRLQRHGAAAGASLLLVLLAVCGFAVLPDGGGTPEPQGMRDGDVVGSPTPLRHVPRDISAVADGSLVVYRMPGIQGRQVNATAMLFVPKGAPPAGGWPLLVWGHGTVGWAPECAPSVQLQEHGKWVDDSNDTLLASVLRMGIAVVAPDYEGLGPVDRGVRPGHGYYHLASEGRSMVYAAVAAQRHLGRRASGQWAPAGWSEGGFAALAAAHYSPDAEKADPELDFRGTIALAPVPDVPAMNKILWRDIDNASQSGLPPSEHQLDQLVFANAETIYFTRTQRQAGYDVDPAQVYGANMLRIYNNDWRTCLDDLNSLVRKDIQAYLDASPSHRLNTYPGARGDRPNALPDNRRFYRENQGKLENSKLPGPVLWLYGTDDITSPGSVTYNVVNKMLINGNDINLGVLEGAGHYDVPTVGRPLVEARLRQLFGLKS
ncbi:alpha/beta hydrolase family protein [Streptomyces meridianus]|uniref:Lipase family protein n=1 Tax=Streptomyces meridianus TaxID=2938945 RepID=A0ABT0XD00_9ACTN|nr:lipase family protein [Streptomyces meridianus]MCM2580155.1 lipase family protein [Streptomyces meridianus]